MKNLITRDKYTIIGNGSVGGALLHFFEENDFPVCSYWNSKKGVLPDSKSDHSTEIPSSLPSKESHVGTYIFLTVPDDKIEPLSLKLASKNINWEGKHVIHCSGNLFADELYALEEKGAKTASMHPLQTFTRTDKANRFKGIFISIQGDQSLCKDLSQLVTQMGATPLLFKKEQKQALHIAAVFASNYFVTLLKESENLLARQQIDEGLDVLEPLILQTVTNVFKKGANRSLTGPVARGDVDSVRKHVDVLASDPNSSGLYKTLGLKTLEIVKENGEIPTENIRQLEKLFRV